MNLILCVDDNGGMCFHHRRQSQDRILREQLLALAGDTPLWMNGYSSRQFPKPLPASVCVDEAFLEKARPTDYCFVEDQDISSYADRICRLVLFKWNRSYPADVFPALDLSGFTLVETMDFAGFSHERITKEIYVR